MHLTQQDFDKFSKCSVRSCTPIGGCDLTDSLIDILLYL